MEETRPHAHLIAIDDGYHREIAAIRREPAVLRYRNSALRDDGEREVTTNERQ